MRAMECGSSEMIWNLVLGVVSMLMLAWAWRVADWVYLTPRRLERALRAQGLRGNPYRLLTGDVKEEFRLNREALLKPLGRFSHNIIPRVAPFLDGVMNQHGKTSFSWIGPTPRLSITDPELIREVLSSKFVHFERSKIHPVSEFIVSGVLNYEGEKWAKHRRILNPAFHLEKLKNMLPTFYTCCDELIRRWESFVASKESCELDIWPEIQNFTGDVISRTAFGNTYSDGMHIFQLQAELAELLQSMKYLYVPGYRYLPTPMNIRIKEINREIQAILKDMIEKRERSIRMGELNDNLLGLLMESNFYQSEEGGHLKSARMTTKEVIDECKLFYFAGQETTSVLLVWTMILLSMHPIWQAHAREEITQVFKKNKPDFDGLNRLKIVTMIINEVLRLYPPVMFLDKIPKKTTELGGLTIPQGVLLSLSLIFVHHDPEVWGEDANQFNPGRFAEGVSKASKNQVALFPFSWGPRICIGHNFSMLKAKMALSMILQHFSFELSPSYIHAPHYVVTLKPQHGAQIILHRI